MKRDRLAILVNIDGEIKLLGIPAIDRGTAQAQFDCLVDVLQQYDLLEDVKGLVFDTTATNTGVHTGTNVRFSRHQNCLILELACRRHMYELHIKHFWEKICSGKTVGPENQTLKKF